MLGIVYVHVASVFQNLKTTEVGWTWAPLNSVESALYKWFAQIEIL